jgi:hypothetical protein
VFRRFPKTRVKAKTTGHRWEKGGKREEKRWEPSTIHRRERKNSAARRSAPPRALGGGKLPERPHRWANNNETVGNFWVPHYTQTSSGLPELHVFHFQTFFFLQNTRLQILTYLPICYERNVLSLWIPLKD